MTNQKMMKKVTMAVIAANVVASSVITTMPITGKAAENTTASNQSDDKLRAGVAQTNLLQNTNFNGIDNWNLVGGGVTLPLTKNADGEYVYAKDYKEYLMKPWANGQVTLGGKGDSIIMTQSVSTIPGHTYKLTYKSVTTSGTMYYRVQVYGGGNKIAESNKGAVMTGGYRVSDGTTQTLEFTAVSTTSNIGYGVVGDNHSYGTMRYSNLSMVDGTTIADTTIDSVTTQSTIVKGKGEPGGTVVIKNNGVQIGTGTVDANGNYQVSIPKQAFDTTLTATVTAKEITSDATQKVKQGPIMTPTIDPITNRSTVATGTGEPGAVLTFRAGGIEYTTTVRPDGKWNVNIPEQVTGTVVQASSVLNGISSESVTSKVTGIVLNPPTINPVKVGDTSVAIQGVPGATIQFTDMNGDVTSKVANASGQATFYIPAAKVNDVFTATQAEINGEPSAPAVYKVVDTSTPDAPTVNPIQDTDTTVTGNGAPNATIEVTIGDKVYTGTTDKDGHFTITIPKQSGGTKVDVVVINPNNGNASTPTQVTVQDTTLGAPDISGIKTGDTVVNVTGAPNAAVTLTLPNGTTLTQTADATGKATFTVPTAKAGEVYKATQTGANGKASPQTSTTVATNQLNAPTIDKYVVGESYVTGKAPAGAKKIALYKDGVLVRYGAVDADGTYKIWGKDALPTVGQVFDVYAVDIAGDLSKKATSTVLSGKSEVTVAPTIDPYTVGDSYVVGKVGANTKKIALYTNGQFVRYGAVDADGTYKMWGKDVLTVVNQAFEVRPVDANGLEGPKANATVKGKDAIKVGAPTVNDYFLKTSYVTGQTSEGTTRIALYVEDQLVKYGAVAADGSYKIYASDALVLAGQAFKVVPFDANGTPGNATTSVVKTKDPAPKLGAPTINDYKLGTSYVTGTTVTGTKRIALYTNDVLVRYAVVAEDGTYKVWGKDALTNVDQTFEVRPYDADGIEGNPALSVVK